LIAIIRQSLLTWWHSCSCSNWSTRLSPECLLKIVSCGCNL